MIGGRATSLHAWRTCSPTIPLCRADSREPGGDRPRYRRHGKDRQPSDYPAVVREARRAEIDAFVRETCGADVAACAARGYEPLQGRGRQRRLHRLDPDLRLPVVHQDRADGRDDVAATAAPRRAISSPAAFPDLTLAEANRILTETRWHPAAALPRQRFGVRHLFPARPVRGGGPRAAKLAQAKRDGPRPRAEAGAVVPGRPIARRFDRPKVRNKEKKAAHEERPEV